MVLRPGATPLARLDRASSRRRARARPSSSSSISSRSCSRCATTPASASDSPRRSPSSRAAPAIADPRRAHAARRLPRARRRAPGAARSARPGASMLLATPGDDDLLRDPGRAGPARRLRVRRPRAAARDGAHASPGGPARSRSCRSPRARLWELRDRHFRRLTRKAYDALGGVGGALAGHAEETLRGVHRRRAAPGPRGVPSPRHRRGHARGAVAAASSPTCSVAHRRRRR